MVSTWPTSAKTILLIHQNIKFFTVFHNTCVNQWCICFGHTRKKWDTSVIKWYKWVFVRSLRYRIYDSLQPQITCQVKKQHEKDFFNYIHHMNMMKKKHLGILMTNTYVHYYGDTKSTFSWSLLTILVLGSTLTLKNSPCNRPLIGLLGSPCRSLTYLFITPPWLSLMSM